MKKDENICNLCEKEISSNTNHFGLICLNKMRILLNMRKVSNIKKEMGLIFKIQLLTFKLFLNKDKKEILTNRYLTYRMLKNIDLNNAKELVKTLRNDIKSINNKTQKENLSSFNMITLKEAYELYKLYNRYKSLLDKTSNYSIEELRNEIQNLPWNTLMFAFSSYYEKKPYLNDLIQQVQYFVWKAGVIFSSKIYPNGSHYLNHSLKENPEDIYITDINDDLVKAILDDENFRDYIFNLINLNSNVNEFEMIEGLNFKSSDLFLVLNNVTIHTKGTKNELGFKLHIVITDVYDFTDLKELNEYIDDNIFKGFIGSILNNSGMASSAFNVINTYNIKLEFDYEVEV